MLIDTRNQKRNMLPKWRSITWKNSFNMKVILEKFDALYFEIRWWYSIFWKISNFNDALFIQMPDRGKLYLKRSHCFQFQELTKYIVQKLHIVSYFCIIMFIKLFPQCILDKIKKIIICCKLLISIFNQPLGRYIPWKMHWKINVVCFLFMINDHSWG